MIKKLIAPLQKLLMQKKICPACTRPLNKAGLIGTIDMLNVVSCKCGRVFIHDLSTKSYHRALGSDMAQMISIKAGNSYLGTRR